MPLSKITGNSFNTSANTNIDNGTLFVNPTTNRVGVAITNPLSEFHVEGQVRTSSGSNFATFNNNFLRSHASGNYFFDNNTVGTDFVFRTSSSSALDTTMLNLKASGTVELPVGRLQFPASQNASSDPNTLDDYEEGTWTPTVWGGGNITTGVGRYVKIGAMVYVSAWVEYGSTANGDAAGFQNLPFTVFNSNDSRGCSTVGYSNYGSAFYAMIADGSTRVIYYNLVGGTLQNVNFSNKEVYFGAVYRVA